MSTTLPERSAATPNRPLGTTQLGPDIEAKLDEVRQHVRTYAWREATCFAVLWCIAIYWVGGLVDYLPVQVGAGETPRAARLAMLIIMAGGLVWLAVFRLLPRLWANLPTRSLALLFQRRFPQLGSSLVTAVELLDENTAADELVSNPAAHDQMLRAAHAEAGRKMESVDASELIRWTPLNVLTAVTAISILASAVAVAANPGWSLLWSKRLFGLSDLQWPRLAVLRADGVLLARPKFTGEIAGPRALYPFENAMVKVPRGADVLLQISADKTAEEVPEVCTIFYRQSGGNRGRANLRRIGAATENWQPFNIDGPPLAGIAEDLSLDVVGLDARIRNLKIQTVDPATISKLKVRCAYPDYLLEALDNTLASRPAVEVLEYRGGLQIPEGTQVSLVGEATCALSRVDFAQLNTEEELMVRSIDADGQGFEIPLGQMTSNRVLELLLIDEHGLPADTIPRYTLNVLPDNLPEVDSRLTGIGSAITVSAILPIRGTVDDDNGIAEASAELTLSDEQRTVQPLRYPDGQIETDIDLLKLTESGELDLEPGQSLSLVVTATDRYDLSDSPRAGSSRPVQLAVVTVDQLLVLLDREELQHRKSIEKVYFELEQMRGLLGETEELIETMIAESESNQQNPGSSDDGDTATGRAATGGGLSTDRLAGVKAQQCVLQVDKSEQELAALASQIDDLRQQLANNRIDSTDRQQRLSEKVVEPLTTLLNGDYEQLQQRLSVLQRAIRGKRGREEVRLALESTQVVLLALADIRDSMLDMESFNEIIDRLRGIVDEQNQILEETQSEQKRRIFDLLK
ncbi:MAG TPA: hypothetical protein DDW52_06935 [Planctomycetaceae bacterium]|nr:hypothetical protein [Planctomycetaceae bacterium]